MAAFVSFCLCFFVLMCICATEEKPGVFRARYHARFRKKR
jgi:hypothetical protein